MHEVLALTLPTPPQPDPLEDPDDVPADREEVPPPEDPDDDDARPVPEHARIVPPRRGR